MSGNLDFLKDAPDRHDPSPGRPLQKPRPLAFAIGFEHQPGSFGMIWGPTAYLNLALSVDGEVEARVASRLTPNEPVDSRKLCIIAFLPDHTDAVIYRWDGEAWVKQCIIARRLPK